MTPADTVRVEAHARRWAVPAAVLGAALPFVAFIARGVILGRGNTKNQLASYANYNEHASGVTATGIVGGIGYLIAAFALVHLLRAIRARRPELPPALGVIPIVGVVLTGLVEIGSAAATGSVASDFVSSTDPTLQRVTDLLRAPGVQVIGYAGLLAGFLFGAGLVILSLNAMRVGLLPRFLGYVGIFAGIFTALPQLLPAPLIFCFWLGAVAYLFAGRWPSGLPPAWRTGRAEPWPSLQEAREAGAAGRGRGRGRAAPEPEPVVATVPPTPAVPGAARRKRKKRR